MRFCLFLVFMYCANTLTAQTLSLSDMASLRGFGVEFNDGDIAMFDVDSVSSLPGETLEFALSLFENGNRKSTRFLWIQERDESFFGYHTGYFGKDGGKPSLTSRKIAQEIAAFTIPKQPEMVTETIDGVTYTLIVAIAKGEDRIYRLHIPLM